MLVSIVGRNFPTRLCWGKDGSELENVHVALQDGREPVGAVAVTAERAQWEVEVRVVTADDGSLDFRGSVVHGKRGDRFLYLTWGHIEPGGGFEMFRRAKLMLNRVDASVLERAVEAGRLRADVDLTGEDGGPRCARVDPPAIKWSAPAR